MSNIMSDGRLKCKCGCGEDAQSHMYWFLESQKRYMRDTWGVENYEAKITSGKRCLKHNEEVGGSRNSSHMIGEALDQAYNSDGELYRILGYLTKIKCRRVIVHYEEKFVHWDNSLGKEYPIDKNKKYGEWIKFVA